MKLKRAIEIQALYLEHSDQVDHHDLDTAIRLGIEALKFRQRWEDQEGEDDFPRLPGETPEDTEEKAGRR